MTKVWYHSLNVRQGSLIPESVAVKSLTDAGASAHALGSNEPCGCGVLFFDEITQRLCDFVREVSRNGLDRVLTIAATGSALAGGSPWLLLEAGASDVFAWDHSADPAREVVARFERWDSVDRLVQTPLVQDHLVGESSTWTSVLRRIVEAARFTDASILITGESGTGKELVARLIHTLDRRQHKRDLVVLDCTTVVPELSGSEFFGHERGSFTGAIAARDGAFALADRGTLFLDEIGELPAGLQAELLRVVQEHTYKPLGSNTWKRTDFRLVCATNRNLLDEEARGQFRRDFYYRIANWTCKLPTLRERADDILVLARHFMREMSGNGEPPELDDPVRDYLLKREYPGNVRQLKQLVSRLMSSHVGPGPITIGDISKEDRPSSEHELAGWPDSSFEQAIRRALSLGVGLKEIGRAATETAIRLAVGDEKNNLQRAAQKLGVTDRALQMRRAVRRADRPQAEEFTN